MTAPVPHHGRAPRAGWARVQTGESIEMFAARTLGDSTRWEEIWSLNRGRTMDDAAPRGANRGACWVDGTSSCRRTTDARGVSGLHLVADTPAPVTAPPAATSDARRADSHVYVVKDGDSYWSIAEDTLRVELGVEPTDRESSPRPTS